MTDAVVGGGAAGATPALEVAVVGGGPAGAMAALMLARAGRRVLLVEAPSARGTARRKIGESLPAIAGHLLRKQGLGALLEPAAGHRPSYGNVSAWGTEALVATDFVNDPHGLGWHLDRTRFDRDLLGAAVEAGASLRVARMREATRGAGGWSLRFDDGTTATAACVIDATGRRATIAKREGAQRTRDDDLLALYTWALSAPGRTASASGAPTGAAPAVRSTRVFDGPGRGGVSGQSPDDESRTLVEATADGWWYTAPLAGGARVLAVHLDAPDVHARLEELLARTTHIAKEVAGYELGATHTTEACGARLDAFVGRGWVATGDAALSFDPVAAQGIFNALYTGMRAGEAVDAALRGDPGGLSSYARRLEEIRTAYVERHRHVYALETRFAGHPFWARRGG